MRVLQASGVAVLVVLMVVPALLIPSRVGGSTMAPAASDGRPNIVLILLDDLDPSSLELMPNVVALLRDQGTSFSNFLITSPSCCPSRASILRGQYVHNHDVLRSDGPNGGFATFHRLRRHGSTIATWLRDQRYRTALIGKYLNGYLGDGRRPVPPGWSTWIARISTKYFDYRLVQNDRLVRYGDRPEDYLTDVLSRHAITFVRSAAAANRPFFLYLAPNAPHDPATPAPRHLDQFPDAQAPRVPSFNEDDAGDKPAHIRNATPLTAGEIDQVDALYRDRLRTLLAVDEMVAALVTTLETSGVLNDTYIFFTSDNGYLLGEHRRTAKGVPYEESIRVPLLVRGPGIAAGRIEDRLALNIDLAPTFAELANVTRPNFVDGRSLLPLLRDEQPAWRHLALVEFFRDDLIETAGKIGDPLKLPAYLALRTGDRLYVEYETGEQELYDLPNDPYQLDNLAADPAYAAEIDLLHDRLARLRTCRRTGCRNAEDAPLAAAAQAAPAATRRGDTRRPADDPSDRRAERPEKSKPPKPPKPPKDKRAPAASPGRAPDQDRRTADRRDHDARDRSQRHDRR